MSINRGMLFGNTTARITHKTFVLAPTKKSYPTASKADLASELSEQVKMCENDIKNLASLKPYPHVIYTGYFEQTPVTSFREVLDGIAHFEDDDTITFIISAHGSPGIKGKFGCGYDDASHPDYRLDADEFLALLSDNEFGKLTGKHVHFQFRCCNSAYAPLGIHEKSEDTIKQSVKEKSLIGYFWTAAQKQFPDIHITVSGVRGYYYPSKKGGGLAKDHSGKNLTPIEEGTITIQENGAVTLPAGTKYKKIQNAALDEIIAKHAVVATSTSKKHA